VNRYNISPPLTEGNLEGNYSTLFRFTMIGGNNSCTDSIFGLAEVLNADTIKIKSLTGKDCSHDFLGGKALLIRE
jgi:hypothetical protein